MDDTSDLPLPIASLLVAPEIALIAVLNHALELLLPTLLAQHPTLKSELGRATDLPTLRLARALLADTQQMRRSLRRYQRAALRLLPQATTVQCDLPF